MQYRQPFSRLEAGLHLRLRLQFYLLGLGVGVAHLRTRITPQDVVVCGSRGGEHSGSQVNKTKDPH